MGGALTAMGGSMVDERAGEQKNLEAAFPALWLGVLHHQHQPLCLHSCIKYLHHQIIHVPKDCYPRTAVSIHHVPVFDPDGGCDARKGGLI